MLVKDIKPIGKVGKNLLKDKNADDKIEIIIEKPLQKACKICKEKNIETIMSSANRKNIVKEEQIINKKEFMEMAKKKLLQNFTKAGKGYAWLMINYNTLSDENKEILFKLENEIGEDGIWFVKSSYNEFKNEIRKFFGKKEIIEKFNDNYAEKFKEKQLLVMYNNKYPRRNVFIRMPINNNTTMEEVEDYFDIILSKLKKQKNIT